MKMMKRVMACVIALVLMITSVPATAITASATSDETVGTIDTTSPAETNEELNATEAPALPVANVSANVVSANTDLVLGTESQLTRAEWLHNLVVVFEMSVESEAMPDNYYSDLDESHEYYEDIILAVEFGVVNIEAGEKLSPDDPLTRDFAASTLNFCLGYQLEAESGYSFVDYEECSAPDSAQIAVDRGWFNLIDNYFVPDKYVTETEVQVMLDDAVAVFESTVVDDSYANTYVFEDDVIIVPEGTDVSESADGVIHITDCPVEINDGEKFAIYFNGIPSVYTAGEVSVTDNITEIVTVAIDDSDVFLDVDAQGVVGSDVMEIVPVEGVDVTFEEDNSGISTFSVKKIDTIKAKTELKLVDGVKANLSVKIKNPEISYLINSSSAFVKLEGKTEISYSIKANAVELVSKSKSIELFRCNVAGIGSFTVSVEVDISGSASGTVEGYLTVGAECINGGMIRAIKSFKQTQYSSNEEASASVALKAKLGVTELPVLSAYLFAEVGVKASLKSTIYDIDEPKQCHDYRAYLYAKYGAEASVKFLDWKTSLSVEYDIFDKSNSPVKVAHHYEDGIEVPSCTREVQSHTYFTKANSRWSGSGWINANHAYSLDSDGTPFVLYDYELDENNQATITQYNGNSWSVYVPETIDGYTVVAIGDSAFEGKSVAYVVLPDTITTIGWGAFSECSNLKEIVLSSNLTTIDSYAFENCVSLAEVIIPNNVTTINSGVFYNCISLPEIVIPNSVTKIDYYAFSGCYSLKEVTLSKNLAELGGSAFARTKISSIQIPKSLDTCGTSGGWYDYTLDGITYDAVILSGPFYLCEDLKIVTFEEGTTQIADGLFAGCTGLEEITIPDTVTTIESHAFTGCVRLSKVVCGNSITTMDSYAFYNCVSLPEIVIPNSVTKIDYYAFSGCYSLKEVTLSKNLAELGGSAFARTKISSIQIPKSLDTCGTSGGWYDYTLDGITYDAVILSGPFYLCEDLKTVTFEEGTTQIADRLFAGCTGLEEITIPDTVTTIESHAFTGCVRLLEVTIGNSVTTIESSAFENCISLPEIVVPNSVTKIDYYAFSGCYSLKEVTLSKNLAELGGSAFARTKISSIYIPKSLDTCYTSGTLHNYTLDGITYYDVILSGPFYLCEDLKTVTFEEGTTQIADRLFAGCTGLEEITIPDTVTTIGLRAFTGCVRLLEVTIGNSVTTIDNYAFSGCVSLPSIIIPNSVTTIENSAFENCKSLKSIDIPDSVASIGSYTFDGCSSLESVKLPNIRQNIMSHMFRNCTSLKTIEFPQSVTTIQEYAFYGCTSLESLVFEDSSNLKEIQQCAFYNCTSLKEAILPEKTKTINASAFQNCTSLEKVYIPQSTKTIGSDVFKGCEKLSDLTIADYSITTINPQTFMDCPGLTKVVLPKGLVSIGSQAFMNDTSLTEVVIPESVTSIDSTAFSYPDKTTIFGKSGSYAETFANEKGFKFVDYSVPSEGLALVDLVEYIVMDRGETYCAKFELLPVESTDVITLTASNSNVTISGHDIYARYAGDTVITATASSGATYEFTIHIRKESSISITNQPDKLSYIMGEELDFTGMKVLVNYGDGSTEEITDYTITGFDSSVEGECTVTVEWVSAYGSSYTTTFTVEIVNPAPKLTGIFVDILPNKLSYALREKLDLTGLVVKGSYTDGSEAEITGYTTSGYNALKKGTQTITVAYEDFTTTFEVEVESTKTLSSVAVSAMPTKIVYVTGEALDSTGLELTLTYSDGSTEIVTTGFVLSGFDSEIAGEKTITVAYAEMTATFTVTVNESQPDIEVVYGDADGDGSISALDAMTVLQFSVEIIGEDAIDIVAADVDGSGAIDAIDAMLILQYDVEIIEKFPVEE